MLKTFIKWCNTAEDTDSNQYDRMQAQLAQCEFAVTKSELASRMMKHELRNYEQISSTIEDGIELAKKQIEQSKQNLVLAKKIRKNRMEYDVLAKVINQQPDRKNTVQRLDALQKELRELEEQRSQLQSKLEVRRKEFTVLMHSINELQNKLGEDSSPMDQSDEGFLIEDDEELEEREN